MTSKTNIHRVRSVWSGSTVTWQHDCPSFGLRSWTLKNGLVFPGGCFNFFSMFVATWIQSCDIMRQDHAVLICQKANVYFVGAMAHEEPSDSVANGVFSKGLRQRCHHGPEALLGSNDRDHRRSIAAFSTNPTKSSAHFQIQLQIVHPMRSQIPQQTIYIYILY